MKENKTQDTAKSLGFWSSMFATVVSIAFLTALALTFLVYKLDLNWQGIEAYARNYNEVQILGFVIPCFLLAPSILVFTVCLYMKSPQEKKTLALMAMVFAIIYVTQISYNYYMQMTAVRQSIKAGVLDGLTPFAFGNFNSTFWSMETLGYTFLSLSMIFSGLLFKGSKTKAAIRWIFLVNGIYGVWAPFEQVLGLTTPPLGLIVFALSFPVATVLITHLFRADKLFRTV